MSRPTRKSAARTPQAGQSTGVAPIARVTVRLQPRASRDELVGWNEDGALRVRVKAPPVDGAANVALVRLLAKSLGIAKSRVSLVTGRTARNKVVEIAGMTADDIRKELTGPRAPSK